MGEEVQVAGGLEAPEGDDMEIEGWQDLSEYQREQSIEEGELGTSQTGIAQEGDSEFEGALEVGGEDDEVPTAKKVKKVKTAHVSAINGTSSSKTIDKAARKKEKKLKLKEEKKRRKEKKRLTA